jgi:hypothetical protein
METPFLGFSEGGEESACGGLGACIKPQDETDLAVSNHVESLVRQIYKCWSSGPTPTSPVAMYITDYYRKAIYEFEDNYLDNISCIAHKFQEGGKMTCCRLLKLADYMETYEQGTVEGVLTLFAIASAFIVPNEELLIKWLTWVLSKCDLKTFNDTYTPFPDTPDYKYEPY